MNAYTPKLQSLLDAGERLVEASKSTHATGLGNAQLLIAINEYELSRLIWDQESELELEEFNRYFKAE